MRKNCYPFWKQRFNPAARAICPLFDVLDCSYLKGEARKLIVMDVQKGITNEATWADYFAKCVSPEETIELLQEKK